METEESDEIKSAVAALQEYICSGNLPNIKYFYLKLGNTASFKKKCRRTPLQYAVELENLHVVQLLVELGADIYETCEDSLPLLPIEIAEDRFCHRIIPRPGVVADVRGRALPPGAQVMKVGKKRVLAVPESQVHIVQEKRPRMSSGGPSSVGTAVGTSSVMIAPRPQQSEKVKRIEDIMEYLCKVNCMRMNNLDADGNSRLTLAVKRNCNAAICYLLKEGADVTLKGPNGITPFCAAVETENADVIDMLLERVPLAEISNGIFHAIEREVAWNIAKKILDFGVVLKAKNAADQTAIHCALEAYQAQFADYLIENELIVQALLVAVQTDDLETIGFFIKHYPHVSLDKDIIRYFIEATTRKGVPIDMFFLTSLNNLDLVRGCFEEPLSRALSLKYLNVPNAEGETLLIQAVKNNNLPLVKLLVEMGANPCRSNGNGENPLDSGVIEDNAEICEYLVQNGSLLTANTALILAIAKNKVNIAKLLVENGVGVNFTTESGTTPLTECLVMKNIEMMQFLLENGADPSLKHSDGSTLIDLATKLHCVSAIKLLIRHGVDANFLVQKQSLIHIYLDEFNADMVTFLIENGADVNKTDSNGECPLVKVVQGMKHCQLLHLLLEKGANPFCEHFQEASLLSVAIEEQYFPVIVFLIEQAGINLLEVREQLEKFADSNKNFAIYWRKHKHACGTPPLVIKTETAEETPENTTSNN